MIQITLISLPEEEEEEEEEYETGEELSQEETNTPE